VPAHLGKVGDCARLRPAAADVGTLAANELRNKTVQFAIAGADEEVVLFLPKARAAVNPARHVGFAPLTSGAQVGADMSVDELMRLGADPRVTTAEVSDADALANAEPFAELAERLRATPSRDRQRVTRVAVGPAATVLGPADGSRPSNAKTLRSNIDQYASV
jgi:hypothetical protein